MKEEAKHTPGPWEVHKYLHCSDQLWLGIGIKIDHSGPICGVQSTAHLNHPQYEIDLAKRTGLKEVAELKYLVTNEKEQWTNAKLIAKAPEMFKLLKKIYEKLDDQYGEEILKSFQEINLVPINIEVKDAISILNLLKEI